MWSLSWKQNPLMTVNCSWMFVRHTAYPVLMEIISISGFFLILGKSSRAPPSLFPFSFFWPSRRTEWPWTQTQRHTQGMAQNHHAASHEYRLMPKRIKVCVPFQHNHTLTLGHKRQAASCHFPRTLIAVQAMRESVCCMLTEPRA